MPPLISSESRCRHLWTGSRPNAPGFPGAPNDDHLQQKVHSPIAPNHLVFDKIRSPTLTHG
jgi:hypothetical protein